MSMVKKCDYEKCKKNAKSVCDCKSKNYYCAKHLIPHISKIGMHSVASIFTEINEESKGKILEDIDKQIKYLIEIKNEAGKCYSEMIANLTKTLRSLSNQISKSVNNYRTLKQKVLLKGKINREELKKIELGIEKPSFEGILKRFADEMTQICENAFKTMTQNNQTPDDAIFFGLSTNKLIKVDYDSLQQSEFSVGHPANYCHSCILPNGLFFIFSTNSNACYIADLASSKLIQVANCPVASNWSMALACIGNVVYAISSQGNKLNQKYSINEANWSRFADNPLPNNYTFGDALDGKICLTSQQSGNTFIYNPVNNIYTPALVITEDGMKHVGHGFILSVANCFKMEDSDPKSWKAYQYSAKNVHCCGCMHNSRLFKKGKHLYFFYCNPAIIYRFDTELFTYQQIKG